MPKSESVTSQVVSKYQEICRLTDELAALLNQIEPGGTLDEITIKREGLKPLRIGYTLKPLIVSVVDGDKKFIVRVEMGNSAH
jgi:hypothetical protein